MSVTDTSGARTVEGPTGRLEVVVDTPRPTADSGERPTPRATVVLAHPHPQHGGTMHSSIVHHMVIALSRIGYIVVRFNFRGVGASTGTFDEGVGESDDFRAMLDYAAEQYPGLGLYAAGYSFGGRIALTAGATDPRVQVLLAVAPPVDRDMTPVLAWPPGSRRFSSMANETVWFRSKRCGDSTRRYRNRKSWSSLTRQTTSLTAKRARSVTRWSTCWRASSYD